MTPADRKPGGLELGGHARLAVVSPVGERVEEVSLAVAHPLVFGAVGELAENG